MATLQLRPRRVDVLFWPGNANSVAFTWPAPLTGRTFTANADGTALTVVKDGAKVTVTFTAAVTAALANRAEWQLVETTSGSQVVLSGLASASPSPAGVQDSTVTVVLEEATVVVTVLGEPGLSGAAHPDLAAHDTLGLATQAELDAHGHATVPVTTVSTTGYTLVLADVGKVVRMTFAGASTLTVPAAATAAFPVGTIINAYAQGGALTISPAAGVTIRNNGTALAQYGEASLRKDGTDEWVRVG